MLRRLWARLRGRDTDGDPDEGDASEAESSGSAFSLLDASVNYAHGHSDGHAVKELQETSERAGELESARDDL